MFESGPDPLPQFHEPRLLVFVQEDPLFPDPFAKQGPFRIALATYGSSTGSFDIRVMRTLEPVYADLNTRQLLMVGLLPVDVALDVATRYLLAGRSVLSSADKIRVAEAQLAVAPAQIDADGQFQQALVQVHAKEVALARAQRLYTIAVGLQQAVDDALVRLELAKKSLDAAKSPKELVDNIKLEEPAGTAIT